MSKHTAKTKMKCLLLTGGLSCFLRQNWTTGAPKKSNKYYQLDGL